MWRELVSSGRLVCRCHDVFLWCQHLCFVLLRFRLHAFVEAAGLRSVVLRSLFPSILFVPLSFSPCMECISYVLSFRMVFFYLVTTGWIFDIGFCENSTKIKNKNKVSNQPHKSNNKPIVMGTQKSVLVQKKLKTFCVSISVFLPLRPKNRSCARKILCS